jgi:hypothetical protein
MKLFLKILFLISIISYTPLYGQLKIDSAYLYLYPVENLKDSVLFEKTYYSHDINNTLYIDETLFLDSKKWITKFKTERKFNQNNKILRRTQTQYDNFSKTYYIFQYENEYDKNGNEILNISTYLPDPINNSKIERLFDAANNLLMEAHYSWNKSNSSWEGTSKRVNIYDSNSNRIGSTSFAWKNKNWINLSKIDSNFDKQGNEIDYTSYEWDNLKNTWIPFYKAQLNFQAKDKYKTSISFYWDKTNNNWGNAFTDSIAYSPTNKAISHIRYIWDSSTKSWMGEFKNENSYNSKDSLTLQIVYEWDKLEKKLINRSKLEKGYNENGKVILDAFYYWDNKKKLWYLYGGKFIHNYAENKTDFTTLGFGWDFENDREVLSGRTEQKYNNNNLILKEFYLRDKKTDQWYGLSKIKYEFYKDNLESNKTEYEWDLLKNTWVELSEFSTVYNPKTNKPLIEIGKYWAKSKLFSFYKKYHYIASSNANLMSLKIDNGRTIEEFKSNTYAYTAVANQNLQITGVPEDDKAKVEILNPTNISSEKIEDRTASIKVIAEDKINSKLYKIVFNQLILSLDKEKVNIKIFPNPVSNYLNINDNEILDIQVFNTKGQAIPVKFSKSDNNIQIDMNETSEGIYFISLIYKDKILQQKVIKN